MDWVAQEIPTVPVVDVNAVSTEPSHWPRINRGEPITAVLKTSRTARKLGPAHMKRVATAETGSETIVGDAPMRRGLLGSGSLCSAGPLLFLSPLRLLCRLRLSLLLLFRLFLLLPLFLPEGSAGCCWNQQQDCCTENLNCSHVEFVEQLVETRDREVITSEQLDRTASLDHRPSAPTWSPSMTNGGFACRFKMTHE